MRGLTHTEQFSSDKEGCGFQTNPFSPSPSLSMYPGPGRPFSTPVDKEPLPLSPYSPIPPSNFDSPLKISAALPHMPHITFTENPPHPDHRHREHDRDKDRGSPIPRRKQVRRKKNLIKIIFFTPNLIIFFFLLQARPMRRSGELHGGPQDLSKNPSSPISETAENLSMKKSSPSSNNNNLNNNNNNSSSNSNNNNINSDHRRPPSHPGTPQSPPHLSVRFLFL